MSERPRTLYEKIWDAHVVRGATTAHASSTSTGISSTKSRLRRPSKGLRIAQRKVRRPDLTLAVADHNLPTTARVDGSGARIPIADRASREQLAALEENVAAFGIPYIDANRGRTRHRPRRRSGAGLHLARHDRGLRRQPHCRAWRARSARLRHRHERGRACAGDPDADDEAVADVGNPGRRQARLWRHAEGPDPGDHRPDRSRRRLRPRH